MTTEYKELARSVAREHGIPEDIFVRLIQVESGWNPRARGRAGEVGLGQLMPGTARALGVDPYDPEQNLRGAARYLRAQYDRFGSWGLALAAYNAGPGAVSAGRVPESTRRYVAAILGRREPEEPQLTGFFGVRIPTEPKTQEPRRPDQPSVPGTFAVRIPEPPGSAPREAQPDRKPTARPEATVQLPRPAAVGRQVLYELPELARWATETPVTPMGLGRSVARAAQGLVGAVLDPLGTVRRVQRDFDKWAFQAGRHLRDGTAALLRGDYATGFGNLLQYAATYVGALMSPAAPLLTPFASGARALEAAITGTPVRPGEDGTGYAAWLSRMGVSPQVAMGGGIVLAAVLDPLSAYSAGAKAASAAQKLERMRKLLTATDRARDVLMGAAAERAASGARDSVSVARLTARHLHEAYGVSPSVMHSLEQAEEVIRARHERALADLRRRGPVRSPDQLEDPGLSRDIYLSVVQEAAGRVYTSSVRQSMQAVKEAAKTGSQAQAARILDLATLDWGDVAKPLAQKWGVWVLDEPWWTRIRYDATKLLERGLTEESRIRVAKVHWLDEPELVSRYVERVRRAESLDPEAKNWYVRAARAIEEDLRSLGVSSSDNPELMVRASAIYAATSIRQGVGLNQSIASEVLRKLGKEKLLAPDPEFLQSLDAVDPTVFGMSLRQKVARALLSYSPGKDSLKVVPFWLGLLIGDDIRTGRMARDLVISGAQVDRSGWLSQTVLDRIKGSGNAPGWLTQFERVEDVPPPVDIWMSRVHGMLELPSGTKDWIQTWRISGRRMQEVAKQVGMLPHEVQAALWADEQYLSRTVAASFLAKPAKESVATVREWLERISSPETAPAGGYTVPRGSHVIALELTGGLRPGATADEVNRHLAVVAASAPEIRNWLKEQGKFVSMDLGVGYWMAKDGLESNPVLFLRIPESDSIEEAKAVAARLARAADQYGAGMWQIEKVGSYGSIGRFGAYNSVYTHFDRPVVGQDLEALGKAVASSVHKVADNLTQEAAKWGNAPDVPEAVSRALLEEVAQDPAPAAQALRVIADKHTFLVPGPEGVRIMISTDDLYRTLSELGVPPQQHDAVAYLWHVAVSEATPNAIRVPEAVRVRLVKAASEPGPGDERLAARLAEARQLLEAGPPPDMRVLERIVTGELGAVGPAPPELDAYRRIVKDAGTFMYRIGNTSQEAFRRWASASGIDLSQLSDRAVKKLYHESVRFARRERIWGARMPRGEGAKPVPDELLVAARDALNDAVELDRWASEARRGVVSDEQVEKTARLIGISRAELEEAVGPGGALAFSSAEHVRALVDRAERAYTEFRLMLDEYARTRTTDPVAASELLQRMYRSFVEGQTALIVSLASASEAGRSLRMWGVRKGQLITQTQLLRQALDEDPDLLRQLIATASGRRGAKDLTLADVQRIADRTIQGMQEGKTFEQALAAARGSLLDSFYDIMTDWVVMAPLEAVSPHLNNGISAMAHTFADLAVRAAAGPIARKISPARSAYVAGEGSVTLGAALGAAVEHFPLFLRALADALRGRDIGVGRYTERAQRAVRRTGWFAELPYRTSQVVSAVDYYTKSVANAAELYRGIHRRLFAESKFREALARLDPEMPEDQLRKWVVSQAAQLERLSPSLSDDLVKASRARDKTAVLKAVEEAAPDVPVQTRKDELLFETPERLAREAREAAERMTWNGPAPPWADFLIQSIEEMPGPLRVMSRLVLRYIRTPVLVTKSFLVDWAAAPFQAVAAVARRDPDRAAEYAVRSAVSLGLFATAWMLSEMGIVDGAGPQDREQKQTWLASGHVPNSIKVGDTRYRLSGLAPLSWFLTVPATMRERLLEASAKGQSVEDLATGVFRQFLRGVVLDATFLRGLADFYDAVFSDLSSAGRVGAWVGSALGSLVPRQLGQVAAWTDRYERELYRTHTPMPEMVFRQLLYQLPGLRQRLPPKLDVRGEYTERAPFGPVQVWLSAGRAVDDPILSELVRLGLSMPSVRPTVTRTEPETGVRETVRRTPAQQRAIQIARGRYLYGRLEEAIRHPLYQQLSDEERKVLLQEIMRRAGSDIRDVLLSLEEAVGAGRITEERVRQLTGR